MSSITGTLPPLAFLLGPWLLLGLVLAGPFLVLLTVFVVAAALPAIVAAPFVLARRLRFTRERHVSLELGRAAA